MRLLWSRISLLAAACLLAATCSFAWMSFVGSRPPGRAGPLVPLPTPEQEGELLFADTDVDLGLIKERTSREIAFENTSDHVVAIRKIRTSCGCTSSESDKQTLNPGEKGRITVTVTPRADRIGAAVHSVTVEYEGAATREAHLLIHVRSRPDVIVANQLDLRVVAGQTTATTFTLVDYRDEPLKIESVTTSSPNVQASVAERPSSYLPGWQYRLEVSYQPKGRPPGDYAETVTVHTSDPDRPSIPVAVAVHEVSRIRVAPAALHLTAAPGADEAVGLFYMDDTEGGAVEVRDFAGSNDLLHCRVLADRQPLAIEVRAPKADLNHLPKSASVRVTLAKPTSEVVCVSIVP